MVTPFYIHQRKKKWYVIFNDPKTGKKFSDRSVESLYKQITGNFSEIPKFTKKTAYAFVLQVWKDGFLPSSSGCSNMTSFKEYGELFWDYEKSPYVSRKLKEKADGISEAYVRESLQIFKNKVLPYVPKNLLLSEFTPAMSEEIKDQLFNKDDSSATVNKTMVCLRAILKEAFNKGLIKDNVSARIINVPTNIRKRDILTEEELKKLLSNLDSKTCNSKSTRWQFLIVALALETGMREGEIQALRPSRFSLLEDNSYRIDVTRSWNEKTGEKTTKTGTSRIVTCSKKIGDEILSLAKGNSLPDGYVFFREEDNARPLSKHVILDSFYEGLRGIGITDEERTTRNIVFHSLRHDNATLMERAGGREIAKLGTGHKTDKAFDIYSEHTLEKDVFSLNDARKKAFQFSS